MSKETEKMISAFNKYIEENGSGNIGDIKDKRQLKSMLHDFISSGNYPKDLKPSEENAETAGDFMELAGFAPTKKEALRLIKKALELEPQNIDALYMKAKLTTTTPEKFADKCKSILNKAEKTMKSEGYFDEENIGNFWLILETRPYMRVFDGYASTLAECGQFRLAAEVYKKMLKLCTGDNLGARYRLMHIYAHFEDEQPALELYNAYPEEESTQFLLPMSILYYKLGNYDEAAEYLKKLCKINKDTADFFTLILEDDQEEIMYRLEGIDSTGYEIDTLDEFIYESAENTYLFAASTSYFEWGWLKIREIKRKEYAKK